MTLTTILADVYRRCGYATAPATDVATRITAFVNETQQDIMAEPGMNWLLNDQTTLASVAAQAEYGLPQSVLRIKAIRDASNRRTLQPMSLGVYRQRYPQPTQDVGVPEFYVDLGMSAVLKQPSSSTQLTVVSTAAGDTTQTAYLQGFTGGADPYPYTQSAALSGTTPVNIPANTTSVSVTKFWVSAQCAGDIVLKQGSTVLATIYSGQFYVTGTVGPHYRMIALVPTPVSAITYNIDYERTVYDLSIASEEPLLPAPFHRLLAIGARAKEYEKQNQLQRMAVARAEFVTGLNQLKYWVYAQVAGSPNLRSYANRRSVGSAVNVTTS